MLSLRFYFVLATVWFHILNNCQCAQYKTFHEFSGSPFHRNKKLIGEKFVQLVVSGQDGKALALVKTIVRVEKAWRQRYCNRVFGVDNCSMKIDSANPFFLWKRKVIFEMRRDPTEEIFRYFRTCLNTSVISVKHSVQR